MPEKTRSVPIGPMRASMRVLQPLLRVEQAHDQRDVPADRRDRQHLGGERDADGRDVDRRRQHRGEERFEVGRVVDALREDLAAAPGLLDRGDDADDVLDADPPVVDDDEHPADDVVDRRPLHAVEPLEVTAEGSLDLGLLLGGRCGDLDLHVPVVGPDAAGVPRERRLHHPADHAAERADVTVGQRVGPGDRRAHCARTDPGHVLRDVQRLPGRRPCDLRAGAGGLADQSGGQHGGHSGERRTGDGQVRGRAECGVMRTGSGDAEPSATS